MTLFTNTAASCLFAVQAAPTGAILAFDRPIRTMTSIGEVSLFFVSAGTVFVDLQPSRGSFLRLLQGQIEQITYTGVIQGYAALQDGDRTSVFSALLEIATVGHYGTFQTEISLKTVR